MIDETWEKEFRTRLGRHYDEMKWLYAEISSGPISSRSGIRRARWFRTGTREMRCSAC